MYAVSLTRRYVTRGYMINVVYVPKLSMWNYSGGINEIIFRYEVLTTYIYSTNG